MRHIQRRACNGPVELAAHGLFRREPSDALPVLLLSAAEEPSSRWPNDLLVGLAERSGGVIWFDTRDCGASSWLDNPYTLDDLASDAVAVLDAFEVDRVHVVGRSMGGEVAQCLTLAGSERVASLVLLSTTPGRQADLAPPADWLVDKMTERLFADPPDDDDERAHWLIEQQEWFAGPVFGFDRAEALAAAHREVAAGWRGANLHGHAVVEAPSRLDALAHIVVPTVVIHGTADPVYPVDHAHVLVERIASSKLVLIEGLGHELPAGFVPDLLRLIDLAISSSS